MMKKLLTVLLTVSILLSMSVFMTSCAHECEFSEAWSKDATHHWHACTGKDCELIADKGEHTWNGGEITTEATQKEDGVKTFTCTACGQTKTEPVLFTGMNKVEWDKAFADSVFENFMYCETATVSTTGFTMDNETIYKFTDVDAWVKMTMMGQSEESYAPDTQAANELRDELVASIKAVTPYEKYSYDAESKTYKAKGPIYIAALEASTPDVALTFADGKLVKIEYTIDITESGIQMQASTVVILSEYGTVSFAK